MYERLARRDGRLMSGSARPDRRTANSARGGQKERLGLERILQVSGRQAVRHSARASPWPPSLITACRGFVRCVLRCGVRSPFSCVALVRLI